MMAEPNISNPCLIDAYRLMAALHIRADEPTALLVARLLEHQSLSAIANTPMLSHSKACDLGNRLRSKWIKLAGKKLPAADDLFWGDMVQFVLAEARKADAGNGHQWVDGERSTTRTLEHKARSR